jgi:hypothetical protein
LQDKTKVRGRTQGKTKDLFVENEKNTTDDLKNYKPVIVVKIPCL